MSGNIHAERIASGSRRALPEKPRVHDWINDVGSIQLRGPRERQEDSALHRRFARGRLIVIADGVSELGRGGAAVASMSAVLGFEQGFGTPSPQAETNTAWARRLMRGLDGALDAMNAALDAGCGAQGMTTALLGVWAEDFDGYTHLRWIGVGDSVLYTKSGAGHLPERLNGRHGDGLTLVSALIAGEHRKAPGDRGLRPCANRIDLHPGPHKVMSGLIIAGSNGLSVMSERTAAGGQPPWSFVSSMNMRGREDRKRHKEYTRWVNRFMHQSPQRFLYAVEGCLRDGRARENTTAVAIRASLQWLWEMKRKDALRNAGGKAGPLYMDRFDEDSESEPFYEPSPPAAERAVLGPALPDEAARAIRALEAPAA